MMLSAEVQQIQEEVSTVRQGRHRWLPYLTLVLLIELILFVHLLPNDPFTRRIAQGWIWQYGQFRRESELRRQTYYDPQIGAKAPEIKIAPVNGKIEFVSAQKPTVLIFIGACTSCVSGDLLSWQRVQDRWHDWMGVIIVSRDSKKRILEFLRQSRITLPIIPDQDGLISKAYNAVWVPRIYGINGAGDIVWLQKDAVAGVDPQKVAQEIWKCSGGDDQ